MNYLTNISSGERYFSVAEIKIDIQRCKGCELCIGICPKKVIKLSDKFNKKGLHYVRPENMENCTGCALCAIVCPDVAITVKK
ncbi:MAG: ferredoxin family protein [Spirochaetes bacterium]|nr:ferredoxin family protein [Spirochaetota bacterium]